MPHPNVTGCKTEEVPPERRTLTVEQFMSSYGFGRTTTYVLLNEGRLQAVKLGRKTLVLRDSAEALVASLPSYREAKAA